MVAYRSGGGAFGGGRGKSVLFSQSLLSWNFSLFFVLALFAFSFFNCSIFLQVSSFAFVFDCGFLSIFLRRGAFRYLGYWAINDMWFAQFRWFGGF